MPFTFWGRGSGQRGRRRLYLLRGDRQVCWFRYCQ